MWSVFKYVVESPESKDQNITETTKEIVEDIRSENILKNIQNEIEKNAENYIISLHYIEFPIVIFYGSKFKDTVHLKKMEEYVEIYKEAKKILLMNKEDDIKGFYFLRNQIYIQKEILKICFLIFTRSPCKTIMLQATKHNISSSRSTKATNVLFFRTRIFENFGKILTASRQKSAQECY